MRRVTPVAHECRLILAPTAALALAPARIVWNPDVDMSAPALHAEGQPALGVVDPPVSAQPAASVPVRRLAVLAVLKSSDRPDRALRHLRRSLDP